MRKWYLLAVMASTVTFVAACGPGASGEGSGAPEVTATELAPTSPSGLPTMSPPTAPPTAPTDLVPGDVVAGRVTRLADLCTEVTTDDEVVWSLSGEPVAVLALGDTVRVKVATLEPGEKACGPGSPARIMSLVRVG